LDNFSEVGGVDKMLVRLNPKDYETNLTVPNDVITEGEGASPEVQVH
jgi:hypothetical protein